MARAGVAPGIDRVFGRLLRRWRSDRGVSQLELALVAGVSAKHLSFLETGRSSPSREMVLRLAAALDLPPHAKNALLEGAGFTRSWAGEDAAIEPAISEALDRMMAHHEPYPLVVMNRRFDVVRLNGGAVRLLSAFFDPATLPAPLNTIALLFVPAARAVILDWERTARSALAHAHGEALRHGDDPSFAAWVRALAATVAPGEAPAVADEAVPAFPVRLRRGELEASFFTTLTAFNAPQSAGAEHVRIESYYPIDDATRRLCEALAR